MIGVRELGFSEGLNHSRLDALSRATEDSVRVQVEGRAFYTGFATFLVEQADNISSAGFAL